MALETTINTHVGERTQTLINSAPAIQARELNVYYGQFHAVRDVNWFPVAVELLVPKGER